MDPHKKQAAPRERPTVDQGGSREPSYRIRPATAEDLPFLWDMLFESLYVQEGAEPFDRSILEQPSMRKYAEDWGRAGDFGVIAEAPDGTPLGSATARYFGADNRGYGYVAPDVPELGMALLPGSRGQGIGTALLERLLDGLRERGARRASLSVDPGNESAMKLYRRFGFEEVGREGTSITLMASLGKEGADPTPSEALSSAGEAGTANAAERYAAPGEAELERDPLIVSLRPEPYARMLAGTKKHEFRRRFAGRPAGAYLYVSAPVGAIAAYAQFGRPIAGTPEELAALAERDEPGSYAQTLAYFDGTKRGFAVPILAVRPIAPLPLADMRGTFGFPPPRSYRRLDAASALGRELAERLAAAGEGPEPG
ncbi:GNAT family N-acetyltransferase [Saccharibacillus brassicae]|uniref:GNAT family N-acetyltransferase n=1 Tax=Saccharibacillus brassicae TaxID=2583377 RepID=A0A4Y6UUE1_SACBS|nr:GNAT family N-acetyltransferase [Saccharibacillus brassicae]QDH20320.1 GNAT family N-acetyltransferase [Saccharibacillus brassicae]